jgi:predicted house-cleaning noncanonical NTP pyrophosphatase (MazG superfamily)
MIEYNKLVRDRIPEIIKKSGSKYKTHIADDKEYLEKLYEKLDEEIKEFKEKPSVEEFVDILQVLEGISIFKGFHLEEIKEVKKMKKARRGGFEKRIILDSTND